MPSGKRLGQTGGGERADGHRKADWHEQVNRSVGQLHHQANRHQRRLLRGGKQRACTQQRIHADRIRVEHLHPKNAQNRASGSAQCDARLQHATGSAGTNRHQRDDRLGHERQQQHRNNGQIGLRGEAQLRGGAAIAHHLRHGDRHNARQQAGKSLLLVSGGDVETTIKDIPGVTSAKAVKHLPNSLEVTIKAQKPAAMLKTSEGTMTAVDSRGRVLNSVSGASVEGIPVIEVTDVNESLQNRSIKEALQILSSLPDSMRNSITKVTAETQDSITTELNDGDKVIVWGDSSQLKLKKAVVDKIINDPNVIGDKHNVDVSAPLRPIIK